MRRLTLSVCLVAVAATPGVASGASFKYGVAAGEVTSSSARLWARPPRAGLTEVLVSARSSHFGHGTRSALVRALASADHTVQVTVHRLHPGTKYFYRWIMGRARSVIGSFTTAPSANQSRTIRFAWSGDADAQPAVGSRTPYYNSIGDQSFAVYRAMQREHNMFNVNLGDTIYSDSEVPGRNALAVTRAQKDAKYRQNLALRNLSNLRGAAAFLTHPDDHEFVNDFARHEQLQAKTPSGAKFFVNDHQIYLPSVRAFRDYAPVGYSRSNGFYRVFHWGKNLDVFFLDERSFRSAKAGSPSVHTCDNPQTGKPDLAPTAPQSKRNLFAFLVPSLSQPVSPACLAAIRDPNRTMLGNRQEAAFFHAIGSSKATFKVIMNEVNIQQYYAFPYDNYEGYEADRQRVLHYLHDHVKNSIFLTTDVHANLVNDARFDTFPPGNAPPANSGILDVTTGPVATMSFKREINMNTGQDPGTGTNGSTIDGAFFTPPPPNGVGMSCSVMDTFSYGEVTASSTQLTINLKDQNGQPIHEEEGSKPACPAIVLNK
ncbi:MAG: alkaline phosphatase [Solirubrobacteraceae bacterium]|nr:alkaline phosphatase [Solirubrobacteraceae bacterium]